MIGRYAMQLGMIHSRLCQVFPGRFSQPFGGTSVGDFGQPPPVGDTPLYIWLLQKEFYQTNAELCTHNLVQQLC